ncbi:MAG: helix-turn-helix transcriptional regulator [Clostridia bacterium]|nr:helix-turn-helix transcriptional regulator [Clostridia bacterium]
MKEIFREIKKQPTINRIDHLNFPAHIHDDIELVFVEKGGGEAYCDGKKYTLTENSFFLAFPNQVHYYNNCVSGQYVLIIMKPSALLSYNGVFEDGIPCSALYQASPKDDSSIYALVEILIGDLEKHGYSSIIAAYLTALFGKLLSKYQIDKMQTSHKTLLQVLQYCAAHYKEPITIESIAKSLHISRSTISHIFSSRLSINFCDYINSLRLLEAEQLLKNKNYSITEISYKCGFSTIRTFNRAFLKRYGISPSEYRNS